MYEVLLSKDNIAVSLTIVDARGKSRRRSVSTSGLMHNVVPIFMIAYLI